LEHFGSRNSGVFGGSALGVIFGTGWLFDVDLLLPILAFLVPVIVGAFFKSQMFRDFWFDNFKLTGKSPKETEGSPGAEKTDQKSMDRESLAPGMGPENSFLKNCQLVASRVNYKIASTSCNANSQVQANQSRNLTHSQLSMTKREIENHLNQTKNPKFRPNVIELPDFSSDDDSLE
jgi:hypothetical protein